MFLSCLSYNQVDAVGFSGILGSSSSLSCFVIVRVSLMWLMMLSLASDSVVGISLSTFAYYVKLIHASFARG